MKRNTFMKAAAMVMAATLTMGVAVTAYADEEASEDSKGLICYSGTSLSYTFFVAEDVLCQRSFRDHI